MNVRIPRNFTYHSRFVIVRRRHRCIPSCATDSRAEAVDDPFRQTCMGGGRRPSGLPSVDRARRRRVICAGKRGRISRWQRHGELGRDRQPGVPGRVLADRDEAPDDRASDRGGRRAEGAVGERHGHARWTPHAFGRRRLPRRARIRPRSRHRLRQSRHHGHGRGRRAHSARRRARDAAGRDRHDHGAHRRIAAEQFPGRREQRLRERLGFGNCGNDRWRRALHDDRIDHFGGSHGHELREHACGCRPPRTALRLGVGHGAPGSGKRRQRCSHVGPADGREASRTAGSRGQRTAVCILLHASRSRIAGRGHALRGRRKLRCGEVFAGRRQLGRQWHGGRRRRCLSRHHRNDERHHRHALRHAQGRQHGHGWRRARLDRRRERIQRRLRRRADAARGGWRQHRLPRRGDGAAEPAAAHIHGHAERWRERQHRSRDAASGPLGGDGAVHRDARRGLRGIGRRHVRRDARRHALHDECRDGELHRRRELRAAAALRRYALGRPERHDRAQRAARRDLGAKRVVRRDSGARLQRRGPWHLRRQLRG